jgi:hypothetical protein
MTKTGQTISDKFTVKDLKKAMIDQDLSTLDIAQMIGKSRSSVSFAINHPTVLPEVRKNVLRILKLAYV